MLLRGKKIESSRQRLTTREAEGEFLHWLIHPQNVYKTRAEQRPPLRPAARIPMLVTGVGGRNTSILAIACNL